MDERSVLARIAALNDLDKDGLAREWKALFDTEPPGYGSTMMRKRITYRIQELAYGGLPKVIVDRMRQIHLNAKDGKPGSSKLPTDIPAAGTILVREYEGVRHEVRIVHEGFEYNGRTWKSLSMIAREITGVNWSGPKFFGLRSRRG
ncbi:MAG: DUF2924 domain-containing protein, partial [Caulobacterales bacterium]|nr:DUF2924 domain-containing protein [Caulobacterales bacterium]